MFWIRVLFIISLYSFLAGLGASIAVAVAVIFCHVVAPGGGVPAELIPTPLGTGILLSFCVSIFSRILEKKLRRRFLVDPVVEPNI